MIISFKNPFVQRSLSYTTPASLAGHLNDPREQPPEDILFLDHCGVITSEKRTLLPVDIALEDHWESLEASPFSNPCELLHMNIAFKG